MNKTTIFLVIIFNAIILGCNDNNNSVSNNEFILKGELKGFENDNYIYLILGNKTTDSAQVLNNKFTIKGIIEHPKEYFLLVKNSQNYSPIWLEHGEIEFKAKNGEFRNAIIKGSISQMENEKLWKPIWKYRKRRDSLTQIVHNSTIDSIKSKANLELEKVLNNKLKIEKEFIKNNPDSYVSVKTLDFYTTSLPYNTTFELYNNLSQDVKNSTYGKSIKRFLELNKNPKIGDKYVDFSMTNENGKLIKLSDFEGNLMLLDFWASWCGPCIGEYPALRKAYSQFNKTGFEIVSVSEDQSKKEWLLAIEKNELKWINLRQDNGKKSDAHLIYGINGIPDNFLIDEDGIIIARDLRGEKLISTIEKHLNEKASR